MIRKKYFLGLLNEGMSVKTLTKLSETQLKNLYKRMVSEENHIKVSADKLDDIKDKVDDTDTIEVFENGDKYGVVNKPKSPSTWKKTVHSKQKSDNKNDVFAEKGSQSKKASKHGHKGFVNKGEKLHIGGRKPNKKEFMENEVDTLTREKKGKTTIPKFMDLNIFKGKMKEIMGGGQEVETPVKPDVKPDVDPGKPRVKPAHRPKPKATGKEVETPVKPDVKPDVDPGKPRVKPAHRPKPKALKEGGKYPKRISLNEKALKQLKETGKCTVNGVEINYKK